MVDAWSGERELHEDMMKECKQYISEKTRHPGRSIGAASASLLMIESVEHKIFKTTITAYTKLISQYPTTQVWPLLCAVGYVVSCDRADSMTQLVDLNRFRTLTKSAYNYEEQA